MIIQFTKDKPKKEGHGDYAGKYDYSYRKSPGRKGIEVISFGTVDKDISEVSRSVQKGRDHGIQILFNPHLMIIQ